MSSTYTSIVPKFKFSVSNLVKQGRVDEDDLKKMMEWLKQEDDMPRCGEQMMCLFLMACEGHIENTKRCLRAYYTVKREASYLFDDRDIRTKAMQTQLQNLQFVIMPKRTKEGYVVIMHRLVNYYPSAYEMDVSMKLLIMTMDASLYKDPPTGVIALFDMRGAGIRHLTRVRLGSIGYLFKYVQEALTLQLVSIHVLNSVWFIDKCMAIIKPFYKPELLEKLNFHKSDMDMEDFYNNCIPKSCLPSDLGGDLEHSEVLHNATVKQLEEMDEFFQQEEKMRHTIAL